MSEEELVCRINQNLDMQDHIRLIHNLANRDYLTNLFNRRYFFTEGKHRLACAFRKGQDVAVAMIDLDHFKRLNDQHGHDAGDEVLVSFAGLMECFFSEDLTARLGGEEFVVFMVGYSKNRVMERLDQFREALANVEIDYSNTLLSTSCSIGVNCQKQDNLDVMMKTADQNLYRAKENGRNQVSG